MAAAILSTRVRLASDAKPQPSVGAESAYEDLVDLDRKGTLCERRGVGDTPPAAFSPKQHSRPVGPRVRFAWRTEARLLAPAGTHVPGLPHACHFEGVNVSVVPSKVTLKLPYTGVFAVVIVTSPRKACVTALAVWKVNRLNAFVRVTGSLECV